MKKSDENRIAQGLEIDTLLDTPEGKIKLWQSFKEKCEHSSLISLLESTLHLDGNIIECGVFRGESIWVIARTIGEKSPQKSIFALDSFEGFPEHQVTNKDATLFRPITKLKEKFKVANDVPNRIERIFSNFSINGGPHVGYFEKTLPKLSAETYCFAHIDSDTYESHIECLNNLYAKVVSGGVIVFDDYRSKKWPGATKAVDEFFADRPEKPLLDQSRTHAAWYVRKI